MKIDNSAKNIGSLQSPSRARGEGVRRPAAGVKAGGAAASQSTTVSSTTLNSVGGSDASFNAQKVAEIRQAISEGRFQIQPERIAEGLISSVREMLAQNRRNT